MTHRRHLLALVASSVLLAACATAPQGASQPPIVFVHGNGDSASLWQTHGVALRIQRLAARTPARHRPALSRWRATTTA